MMVGQQLVVEVWVGGGREGTIMSPWWSKTYGISGRVTHFYVKSQRFSHESRILNRDLVMTCVKYVNNQVQGSVMLQKWNIFDTHSSIESICIVFRQWYRVHSLEQCVGDTNCAAISPSPTFFAHGYTYMSQLLISDPPSTFFTLDRENNCCCRFTSFPSWRSMAHFNSVVHLYRSTHRCRPTPISSRCSFMLNANQYLLQ